MESQHGHHVDATGSTFYQIGRDQVIINQSVTYREQALQNLKPALMDASVADRSGCLPETRVDVIRSIFDWADDLSSGKKVLWLHGLAGSGKSTLCTTTANLFREAGRLGAFLFFNRDVVERSNPTTVVRTLAYQLGLYSPQIGTAITTAIEQTPSICMSPLRLQFIKLIIEPLSRLDTLATSSPLILIIDALDECGDAKQRKGLLSVLAAESHRLPSFLRILITSRAEFDIRYALEIQPHVVAQELDITSEVNSRDISHYLRHRMSSIRSMNRYLEFGEDWPGEDNIEKLCKRASGLFVWAATASEFIDRHDPAKCMEILLKDELIFGAQFALDALYRTALESVGRWNDADFIEDFRSILGLILVVKNPLSGGAIDSLLGTDGCRPSMHTLSHLACVIVHSPTARVLHPSFADFLMDPERCGRDIWYIDKHLHNLRVATKCLDRLQMVLKRNMCNLTLDPKGPRGSLPEGTAYACAFWIEHVCMITKDVESTVGYLNTFLHQHILHWLEAMSILGQPRETIRLLNNLLDWVQDHASHRRNLYHLVNDAFRLVQSFIDLIEEHPLSVYTSALPFAPVDCYLYQTFHDNLSFPRIMGGFQQSWSPLLLVFAGHQGAVSSVAASKDGRHVASGSKDNTIRVWDMASGVQTLSFEGHGFGVSSVAFSPDGRRIASGSDDATIRLWDTMSGTEALLPFQGHEGPVTCVTFSPQGCRIISASVDMTIRVWDAAKGVQMLGPLRGHQDRISSISVAPNGLHIVSGSRDGTIRVWDSIGGQNILAFSVHSPISSVHVSPDGRCIVSGSADATIRVWDLILGRLKMKPLRGHKNGVSSVSFSPDGKQVLSSSEDMTIRIWNTFTGEQVFDALYAHDRHISSAIFSSDGKHIISGSWDYTIRIWDSTISGTNNAQLVQGHRECIFSLAFSPCGAYIVSGSTDGTIRVWNATTGEPSLPCLLGHNSSVSSVLFSPDGRRIVSGSDDGTIRVWDAASGKEVIGPLRGHEDVVSSVHFTLDGLRIISGSWDKTIRVWDSSSGTEMSRPLRGHARSVSSVASSQDGKWIVSSSLDMTVRLWNAALGEEAFPALPGPDDGVPSVSFSSDGTQILAHSQKSIYIWDLEGNLLSKFRWDGVAGRVKETYISSDRWIKSFKADIFICKLPRVLDPFAVSSWSAFKQSMAIGLESGRLLIIHFPASTVISVLQHRDINDYLDKAEKIELECHLTVAHQTDK